MEADQEITAFCASRRLPRPLCTFETVRSKSQLRFRCVMSVPLDRQTSLRLGTSDVIGYGTGDVPKHAARLAAVSAREWMEYRLDESLAACVATSPTDGFWRNTEPQKMSQSPCQNFTNLKEMVADVPSISRICQVIELSSNFSPSVHSSSGHDKIHCHLSFGLRHKIYATRCVVISAEGSSLREAFSKCLVNAALVYCSQMGFPFLANLLDLMNNKITTKMRIDVPNMSPHVAGPLKAAIEGCLKDPKYKAISSTGLNRTFGPILNTFAMRAGLSPALAKMVLASQILGGLNNGIRLAAMLSLSENVKPGVVPAVVQGSDTLTRLASHSTFNSSHETKIRDVLEDLSLLGDNQERLNRHSDCLALQVGLVIMGIRTLAARDPKADNLFVTKTGDGWCLNGQSIVVLSDAIRFHNWVVFGNSVDGAVLEQLTTISVTELLLFGSFSDLWWPEVSDLESCQPSTAWIFVSPQDAQNARIFARCRQLLDWHVAQNDTSVPSTRFVDAMLDMAEASRRQVTE